MTTAPAALLINPRMCGPGSLRLPLSLLALAGALEGRYRWEILDGNLIPDLDAAVTRRLAAGDPVVAGISVMPGPQVGPATAISRRIRDLRPEAPIVWGGYFPSLYTDAALRAPYVDVAVIGPGEHALAGLMDAAAAGALRPGCLDGTRLRGIAGIAWREGEATARSPARPLDAPDDLPPLPLHRLPDPARWLRPTFLGRRTGAWQAATGCRWRCAFCGVVSVFNGQTRLSGPERLIAGLEGLRRIGADSVQFYDNNFFDSEAGALPVLEAMAGMAGGPLPWWCYARADTMARFAPATWALLRRSGMRMAYIGAEAGSDAALRAMRKGSRVDHTLEVAARLKEIGAIPEFSFVLGGPDRPEEEILETLAFVRRIKAIHPEAEVILYFYTPTPQRDLPPDRYGAGGPPLPTSPEEWAQPRWVSYVCHQDAPWLSEPIRRHIRDFERVLACRFPTVQDHRLGPRRRALLSGLARWRYERGVYAHAWELEAARRLLRLRRPEREGL